MTPQEIAKDIAAFFRKHPTRWRRGTFGSRETGCCVFGAARDMKWNTINERINELNDFANAFEKACDMPSIITFNDKKAKDVHDVIAVLDKVAAS